MNKPPSTPAEVSDHHPTDIIDTTRYVLPAFLLFALIAAASVITWRALKDIERDVAYSPRPESHTPAR